MKQPDQIDISRSFEELNDDEAIAIMEGRQPAVDRAEVDEVALAIARGLIEEPDLQAKRDSTGGSNVVELILRQPWMKMAAALLFGVMLSSVVDTSNQFAGGGAELSVASANLVYLEVERSTEIPVVTVAKAEP